MLKRMKFLMIILLIFSFYTFQISWAQIAKEEQKTNEAQSDIKAAKELLEQGIRFSNEEDLLKAEEIFSQADSENQDYNLKYLLSFTQHNLSTCYLSLNKKEKAAEYNDKAIQNAELSIKLNDNFSDSHALLGNLYGMKISFSDSFLAGMQYGPKAQLELEKALQIDDKNPRAHFYMGVSRFHTPKMYGGNIEKAIEHFNQAVNLDPHYYDAYIYLAKAWTEKKDYQNAYHALLKAINIDPKRKWAKSEIKKLENIMNNNSKKKLY